MLWLYFICLIWILMKKVNLLFRVMHLTIFSVISLSVENQFLTTVDYFPLTLHHTWFKIFDQLWLCIWIHSNSFGQLLWLNAIRRSWKIMVEMLMFQLVQRNNSSRYVVKRGRSQSWNTLFSALLTEHLQRQEVNILNLESTWHLPFGGGGGGSETLKIWGPDLIPRSVQKCWFFISGWEGDKVALVPGLGTFWHSLLVPGQRRVLHSSFLRRLTRNTGVFKNLFLHVEFTSSTGKKFWSF